jgi:signal transduction histidine kinase
MAEQLRFKVSSALKNIIGSDLISDDFIAVFELVKNAYDAHATRVEVCFVDLYTENAKIIIQDNGKGMNYDDLINKWLFVAYSAKKDGTEENNYDYRNRIKVKRAYAGAKGIGRFSCDRLGHELYLETIKDEPNAKVESLLTEWDKFEGDLKDEFVNISVLHETIEKSNYEISFGTVLEISNLKSEWSRDKILKLKGALAKLINPNTKNSNDVFEIWIKADSELNDDDNVKQKGNKKGLSREAIYKDVVNGRIENLIFEELDLKTTKIVSEVSINNTSEITTSLYEGGKLVYRVKESNPMGLLHDVDFTIYYLNRSAKVTFNKRMGIPPVEYGHIFVYKNGLRVFPYGERGEDPLKMDNRKAQGQNRNLGTREVIGYINILNSNDDLNETSSRGDGLKKTETYFELYKWFYVTLKRLERYIVDVSDWGRDLSEDDYINLDENDRIVALQKIVSKLTKLKSFISIEYAPDLFQILDQKQDNSARSVLSQIKDSIIKDDFNKEDVLKGIRKAETKINELEKRTDEAEDEAIEGLVKNEMLEQELETEQNQNKYLIATRPVSNEVFDIVHAIKISSQDMDASLKSIFRILEKEKISNPNLIQELEFIKFNNDKSKLLSEFITKADLKDLKQKTWIDIPQYIKEYVEKYNIGLKSKFVIRCVDDFASFRSLISILDLSIIIDNLISNSRKAEATKMLISFGQTSDKKLFIDFIDNGLGLSREYVNNPEMIFKLGITNKNGGSGIGLFTLKEIIKENLQGDIFYNGVGLPPQGATFRIIIK